MFKIPTLLTPALNQEHFDSYMTHDLDIQTEGNTLLSSENPFLFPFHCTVYVFTVFRIASQHKPYIMTQTHIHRVLKGKIERTRV